MSNQQEEQNGVSRRAVISRALLALGATSVLSSTALLNSACAATGDRLGPALKAGLEQDRVQWLDEVAETILPETSTPGAKAAQVGAFIALMVEDTFSPQEQTDFEAGLESLEQRCELDFGVGFLAATSVQRLELLNQLDAEQHQQANQPENGDQVDIHYFRKIKELTLLGYFTSEVGYRQAQRYIETPGAYDPCIEYTPGERAWARHA